jgi:hypothetical protein
MSTDYAEKERDFIAGLAEDTGRDLAGWMAAIATSGLNERNAIIDWLRLQGFQFAKASWLERIHHNGGRLIYADQTGPRHPSERRANQPATGDEPPPRGPLPGRQPPPQRPPSPTGGEVQRLLADAKGLRPLAEHILREIERAVPETGFTATSAYILMSAPLPFAALLPGAKKLRLYARFGPAGAHRATPADAAGKAPPPFAEMLLLDDARSIDEDFLRLIRAASRQ